MQRPAHVAIGPLTVQLTCGFKRLGIEFDDGAQLRIQPANPRLQVSDQIGRSEPARQGHLPAELVDTEVFSTRGHRC